MDPVNKSLPMHLSVRAFPAFWVPKPLPDHIKSKEQAEEYAKEFALKESKKVCLSVPGELNVWFDEKGRVTARVVL
ncbi:MAG: hypothetical protein ACC669_05685 [bacterium]